MTGRDIVVVGASAGGVEALPKLTGELPQDFPGSVFVVLHLPAHAESFLPDIINRNGALRAVHPVDRQKVERGVIYVAPPDYHLWLQDSRVRVTAGPRINRHRPAVDALFESAAHVYKQRVIGVILTGSLGDGSAGLSMVKKCGGVTVVQDPNDALVSSMPTNALRAVKPDHILPLAKIPPLLARLAVAKIKFRNIKCPRMRFFMDTCSERPDLMQRKVGAPSSVICPECGGPLWELRDGRVTKFRCLVGHSFSPESLLDGEREELERALWTSIKILEERSTLLKKLAVEAHESGHLRGQRTLKDRAAELEKHAEVIRKMAKKIVCS
jgi:two-component system chemotaxis response regulator CheB